MITDDVRDHPVFGFGPPGLVAKGSPDSTGLVLLDAEVTLTPPGRSFPTSADDLLDLGFEALFGKEGPITLHIEDAVIVDESGEVYRTSSQEGVVLFSNLRPGQYRLSSLQARCQIIGFLRDSFECDALDPIAVKGFDRPVEIYRVVREA